MTEFDYIIAGAGTAGCVLAARLTQNAGTRVLLLEAGSAERTRAMTVPDAWPELLGTEADWADATTAQADAGPVAYPRGRVLGGSDPDAVVDTDLRVRGITGLRIADASVIPVISNAPTSATVLAIAEKAAAMISGR